MSRYIDADDYEVQLKIDNHLNGYTDLARALHILRYQQTADVRENVKGEWIRNDNGTYSCSICHTWIPEEQHHYARYCLYCGADMRGET